MEQQEQVDVLQITGASTAAEVLATIATLKQEHNLHFNAAIEDLHQTFVEWWQSRVETAALIETLRGDVYHPEFFLQHEVTAKDLTQTHYTTAAHQVLCLYNRACIADKAIDVVPSTGIVSLVQWVAYTGYLTRTGVDPTAFINDIHPSLIRDIIGLLVVKEADLFLLE